MKKKFHCEIDCANCAAKVEEAIRKIEGVEEVSVNFLTRKMTLTAADDKFEEILQAAVRAGKKIEPDFEVEC